MYMYIYIYIRKFLQTLLCLFGFLISLLQPPNESSARHDSPGVVGDGTEDLSRVFFCA